LKGRVSNVTFSLPTAHVVRGEFNKAERQEEDLIEIGDAVLEAKCAGLLKILKRTFQCRDGLDKETS